MLVLSLAAHLIFVLLFVGDLLPRPPRDLRPVYQVDLVNLPVRDPQAGRPDARPAEKPAAPQAEPAVVAKPEPPKPPPAKPEAPVKPEPAKAVAQEAVKTPAPVAAKPEVKTADSYDATANVIEQMRQKKELEERLAALKAATRQSAAAPVEAPVGMPIGKGKEAGVDEQLWIQKFLKESWNLSKYQVTRRDLKAKARLVYDAGGQLLDYRIVTSSGDSNFDESVRRAILKAKQLPFRPERRLELEDVEFNLKDLLD